MNLDWPGTDPAHTALGRSPPCLNFMLCPPELRQRICFFSRPVCGPELWQPQETSAALLRRPEGREGADHAEV